MEGRQAAIGNLNFEILDRDVDTRARLGRIQTSRGSFTTPAFLPVGTRGAVKAMAPWELQEIGFEIILANTYHLYLRPGVFIIKEAGGIHDFMAWQGPLLTDSGGFQVFSLSKTLSVEEEGVVFRSIYDGSEHLLSPQSAVSIQEDLGSDIAMALDHCLAYPASRRDTEKAVDITLKWAGISQRAQRHGYQALFGIVQGGTYPDLRRRSAEETAAMDFQGYGIGGLSVGEPRGAMLECLEVQTETLPETRPRHLLGIGDPQGVVEAVARGVDMFDCVMPTRMARNGVAFTRQGKVNLRHARYADDLRPLDDDCSCPACSVFTRAYLRHLHRVNEILAHRLLTWHNLVFMHDLILDCRAAIGAGRMVKLIQKWKGWDDRPAGD